MKLSAIIKTYQNRFIQQYGGKMSAIHHKALAAMRICRTKQSPKMLTSCNECDHEVYVPHSCGHRNCPHCQAHEGQQWLERQLKKQVPAEYFLVTFTLPAQFRKLFWNNQKILYALLIRCAWETLKTFSQNDAQLQGIPGAIAVLHTHARDLQFHPHVHIVIPAASIDKGKRLWRCKTFQEGEKHYLFNHKALAKVFRAKILDGICKLGLALPASYPEKWVVDCKSVGSGEKALIYLGRYLYRGVIQEKDIVSEKDGYVTYRFQNSKTKKTEYRKVTGEEFLWLILQHILPKGFRRARNFGFLHPNSKQLIQVLQLKFNLDPNRAIAWMRERPKMVCSCCGGVMNIIKTRIKSVFDERLSEPVIEMLMPGSMS